MSRKAILFILSVFAILALISLTFPQPSLSVGPISLKFPSISEMLADSAVDARSADDIIASAEQTFQMQPVDSAALALADSLRFYENFFATSPTRIYCPNNDPSYLYPIFDALDSAQNHLVHIMHYGDSQIEGDRISGYLRAKLQGKFGGYGPGLIPLQQPIPSMAIAQSLSDSITMRYAGGMMGPRAKHKRYGAMAQVAEINCKDTLIFRARSTKSHDIRNITFYAASQTDSLSISVNGTTRLVEPNQSVRPLRFNHSGIRMSSMQAEITGAGEIYGIAISAGSGVIVTNVPLRGSEGTFFAGIDKAATRLMLRDLNTQMVILEFGGNALPALNDTAGVDKYCRRFATQIKHFQTLLPSARILVIGPADMSIKRDGVLQTHPLLPYLADKMRQTSNAAGAAYWDMYGVMGGRNSMIAWVKHNPKWAATDYIHFTRRGAERISEILWESLMMYYNYHQLSQKHE